jgi:hypothetical protein
MGMTSACLRRVSPHRRAQTALEVVGRVSSLLRWRVPAAPEGSPAESTVLGDEVGARRQALQSGEAGPRRWRIAERQVGVDTVPVGGRRHDAGLGQRPGLGGEGNAARALGEIERLHSRRVPRQHEPVRADVEERQREHAVQPLQAVEADLLVEMNDDLAVGLCAEAVTFRQQLGPQLAVVVDLTVTGEHQRAVLVLERLPSSRQVDQAQPVDSKTGPHRRREHLVVIVGPAMDERAAHPLEQRTEHLIRPGTPVEAGDAAHVIGLLHGPGSVPRGPADVEA